MDEDLSPSLLQLLPSVEVKDAVLRHARTLFYSSSKHNEHLANLSICFQADAHSLVVNSLLPTTFAQDSSAPSSTSIVIPLLSRLESSFPPIRRPTQITDSMYSLFPPSATCQASPPIQIHMSIPNVRLNLSEQTNLSSSSLVLVQNSIYILLTTGQMTETAGVLLSSRQTDSMRKSSDSRSKEFLEPATFDTAGDIAGVWVKSENPDAATLALYALAAAWWTHPNRRLNAVPLQSTATGDWYERRLWLIRFHDAGRISMQSGSMSVCDDNGTHFVASLDNPSSTVQFEASAVSSKQLKKSFAGEGWRSRWVASPTPNEVREAEIRFDKNRTDGLPRDVLWNAESRWNRNRLSRSRPSSGGPASDYPADAYSDQNIGAPTDDSQHDDSLLFAQMLVSSYPNKSNDQLPNASKSGRRNDSPSRSQDDVGLAPNKPYEGYIRARHYVDAETPIRGELDSDGELNDTGTTNIDDLCKKYLNRTYDHEVKKEISKKGISRFK